MFEVDDWVWLNNKDRKRGFNPKLQPKWSGPFTLLERLGIGYVIRADDSKKQIVVHQQRLKPCFTEERPVLWQSKARAKSRKQWLDTMDCAEAA